MTDLRPQAIEAMARAFFSDEWNNFDTLHAPVQDAIRDDAASALDALVGFLTEHADEWYEEWFTSDRTLYSMAPMPEHLPQLLAVLGDSE